MSKATFDPFDKPPSTPLPSTSLRAGRAGRLSAGKLSILHLILSTVGLGGLVLATLGCDAPERSVAAQGAAPVRSVRVAIAGLQPLDRTVTALGALEAYQEATLSAKVDGRLEAIGVDIGSKVEAGALLARVETRDYELRLQQAQAAVGQARARLGLPAEGTNDVIELDRTTVVREAQAVFDEAKASRQRLMQLTEAKVISPSELETAEAVYQVALNRVEAARDEVRQRVATLKQRRTEVEIARQQLEDTRILAPFAGVVQIRRASLGHFLRPGDPVLVVVQVNPLRLRLEVPEMMAGRISVGQEVRFSITGSAQTNTVKLTRISPALQRGNRMLVAEADVPNNGTLHPGAFAESHVIVERDVAVLAVPVGALRVFAGLEKILVEEQGVIVEKQVVTGARSGPWIEVREGLKPGERVILDPGGLRAGQRVDLETSS